MAELRGFPPVGSGDPLSLILGSFPSVASLDRGEYYAHERNHFWAILGAILGFDPSLPYALRVEALAASRIALWDVLSTCEREGSLDRDIRSERPNAIDAFVAERPCLERIALNGGKAASSFRAYAAPELRSADLSIGRRAEWRPEGLYGERPILICRLPSTSPVPSRDYRGAADKIPAWAAFLEP